MGPKASKRSMAADSDHNGSDTDSDDEPELSYEELLSANPFQMPAFSKRKLRYMALFDVEQWSSALDGLTFATASAPLTWDEAVAVQHHFQEGICGHSRRITEADDAAVAQLRRTVDGLFARLAGDAGGGPGFFVRLGPRSPKDAPMIARRPAADTRADRAALCGFSDEQLRAALEAAAVGGRAGPPEGGRAEACDVLRRFNAVCYGLLRVASPEEAVRLLLGSSRVMQDVSRALDKGRAQWGMSVVARRWDADVVLEREFRAFVVGGALTAISQYDDQLAYPVVVRHRERIVAAILQGLEEARPRLLGLACAARGVVVDFVVVPGGDAAGPWRARIVELNPFGPFTGASLFHWSSDRRLLQGGRDLYGDLAECERETPAGSVPVPPHVHAETILGVPFRCNAGDKPGFDWDHLIAFWEDYVRLAPSSLLDR